MTSTGRRDPALGRRRQACLKKIVSALLLLGALPILLGNSASIGLE